MTLKVYVVEASRPDIVVVVPFPVVVAPPGEMVIVQSFTAGSPLNWTEAVDVVQEGCRIVPIIGAVG